MWQENGRSCFIISTHPQGMWHAWNRGEKCKKFWRGSPKDRDHSEDEGVEGRMGSEWILGTLAGCVNWIRLAQNRDLWRAIVLYIDGYISVYLDRLISMSRWIQIYLYRLLSIYLDRLIQCISIDNIDISQSIPIYIPRSLHIDRLISIYLDRLISIYLDRLLSMRIDIFRPINIPQRNQDWNVPAFCGNILSPTR
jgi:hypothetical protein